MSKTKLPFAFRRAIAAHYRFRCAYCQSQEAILGIHFTVDHIIPEALGGSSEASNLCLACWDCNLAKSQRIAARDPLTGEWLPLYHPQRQPWHQHFTWQAEGVRIAGITASGRATVLALELNRAILMRARQRWVEVGWHPPED